MPNVSEYLKYTTLQMAADSNQRGQSHLTF